MSAKRDFFREDMELTFRMPGSCGEMMQGLLNGVEVLISFPLNIYNSLTISQYRGERFEKLPVKMRKGIELTLQYLHLDINVLESLAFLYHSTIPTGVGMSSSTADLVLACGGLAYFCGTPLMPEELAQLLVQIEPTDSILFPEATLFQSSNGQLIQTIAPYPEMEVLVLGTGEAIDTIEFRQKRVIVPDVMRAYELIYQGLLLKDVSLVAKGATLSAENWQEILYKPKLEEIKAIAINSGCLGIQVAHSGTVVGILYDSIKVSRKFLHSCLEESGILDIYPYVWHLHTVQGGLEVRRDGKFEKVHLLTREEK